MPIFQRVTTEEFLKFLSEYGCSKGPGRCRLRIHNGRMMEGQGAARYPESARSRRKAQSVFRSYTLPIHELVESHGFHSRLGRPADLLSYPSYRRGAFL